MLYDELINDLSDKLMVDVRSAFIEMLFFFLRYSACSRYTSVEVATQVEDFEDVGNHKAHTKLTSSNEASLSL